MCGIAGIIYKNDKPMAFRIQNMLNAIKHRGPDNQSVLELDYVQLAHARLSIIDLSSLANQPMVYGGFSMVFNGEIYNYKELKKELVDTGVSFKTNSDTEVILMGVSCFGLSFIEKLNGIFAIVIYDKSINKVHLIRDHFGVKPLYYYYSKNELVFSSEINSIKAGLTNELTIDKDSIRAYLKYLYIPGNNTIYKELKSVEPATIITLDVSDFIISKERYWDSDKLVKIRDNNEIDIVKKLDIKLNQAIESNLISDVPIGVLLSGGVDSSLICAIASKYYDRSIQSFSIIYSGTNTFEDERQYARIVSQIYKTNHFEIEVDTTKVLNEIDNYINIMDLPYGDPSFILNSIISQKASKHVKVALSGAGGDELFGGYNRYQALIFKQKLDSISPNLLKFIDFITKNFPENRSSYFGNLIRGIHTISNTKGLDFEDTYHKYISYSNIESQYSNDIQSTIKLNNINDVLLWDIKNYLVNDILQITDNSSMRSALELRVPFLYKDLVDFAFSIPINQKVDIFHKKKILKQVAENYIPKEVIYRRKQGFSFSINDWIKQHSLIQLKHKLTNEILIDAIGEFYIDEVLDKHFVQNIDMSVQIYSIYVMSKWLDIKHLN